MKNLVGWFDLPVKNLDRAIVFYSTVFGVEIQKMEGAPKKYAMFPHTEGFTSGGLVEDPSMVSDKGTMIYFDGGEDLAKPLSRVKNSGGTILQDKMSIGPNGFMAIFLDTEGNRIAIHSMK